MKSLRTMFFGAAAAAALAASAFAADMPLKAVPYSNPFVPGGSGWYVGLGTTASLSANQVSGNNAFTLTGQDLNANGGTVDVAVGYINGNANQLGFLNWYRVELSASYENITATSGPISTSQRWAATQEVDFGADVLTTILQAVNIGISFPSFTPTLPGNVALAATPKQYVGFMLREYGVSGQFGSAGGETVAVAPGLKSGFIWPTLDKTGKLNGGALDAFAWVAWPVRGFTVANVLAPGGVGPTVQGGVSQGTQFGAGIKYDIGVSR